MVNDLYVSGYEPLTDGAGGFDSGAVVDFGIVLAHGDTQASEIHAVPDDRTDDLIQLQVMKEVGRVSPFVIEPGVCLRVQDAVKWPGLRHRGMG